MLDVMTVKDIYIKLIVPCIGRDGYWVSEMLYTCICSFLEKVILTVYIVWHCILYFLSFLVGFTWSQKCFAGI